MAGEIKSNTLSVEALDACRSVFERDLRRLTRQLHIVRPRVQTYRRFRDVAGWTTLGSMLLVAVISWLATKTGSGSQPNPIGQYVSYLWSVLFMLWVVLFFVHRRAGNRRLWIRRDRDRLQLDLANVSSVAGWERLLLNKRIREEQDARDRSLWKAFILLAVCCTFVASGVAAYFTPAALLLVNGQASSLIGPREQLATAIGLQIYTVGFAIWMLHHFLRVRTLQREIDALKIDYELKLYPAITTAESRADKLFRLNQAELAKYYKSNLRQNRQAFAAGMLCISAGVLIAYFTISQVGEWGKPGLDLTAKIFAAAIGLVGTLMTNVVAAIFLRMHTSVNRSLDKFHGRLVESSQMFLANLIATGIPDDSSRTGALSNIVLGLSGNTSAGNKSPG